MSEVVSDDERLRFAIEQYMHIKLEGPNVKLFAERMSKAAGVAIRREDISRFLNKNAELPVDKRGPLLTVLSRQGFWPHVMADDLLFPAMAMFFGADVIDDELRGRLEGRYRYYQRSSRFPGLCAVSEVSVAAVPGRDYLRFDEVVASEDITERFRGFMFRSNGDLLMLLREDIFKRPKMLVVCNIETRHEDGASKWIDGFLLKTTRYATKRHRSNFYMERIEQSEPSNMGIFEMAAIASEPRKRLNGELI